MKPFGSEAVARAFAAYPPPMRRKLLALRELIFDTAAATDGIGEIEETLSSGANRPTCRRRRASAPPCASPGKRLSRRAMQMYFHCQTNLVESFRTLFPHDFRFDGNRAIVFEQNDAVPADALAWCVAAALTYHRRKASP